MGKKAIYNLFFSGYCFSHALIGYSTSEYPVLFTSRSSERATQNVARKMVSRFTAVTDEEISQIIKQAVPDIHEEGDKGRFGSFNR